MATRFGGFTAKELAFRRALALHSGASGALGRGLVYGDIGLGDLG